MLLIRNSRLMENIRNGSTAAVQRGPSSTGMNSGATTQRKVLTGSDSSATIASARSYPLASRCFSSWTCDMTGNSTRFTMRPKIVAGITIRL